MTHSVRRTPAQWQDLLDQWRDSGLSAVRFCENHGIGYASFCNWRKRRSNDPASSTDAAPSFIDLGTLSSISETRGWNIVLSLGHGIEIRLSRG